MPRPTKTKAPEPPNSVIASAARVSTRRTRMPKASSSSGLSQQWQDEAWHFADTVGELAFANQWIANALSRVTLVAMEVMADGSLQPSTNPEAQASLDALFYGETGQAQMLHTMGWHLTTPGETYLVGIPPAMGTSAAGDTWRVLSNKEIKQEGSRWIIDRGDGQEERYEDGSNPDKPAEALVIRIWRPHAAKWVEATSPVRAALPILRELEGLTKHIAATIDSRLAGAGMLVIPKEATFETPLNADTANVEDSAEDPFMAEFTDALITPIRDRGSASAVVPVVVRLPGELVDKVQHIKFWSDFSEKVLDLIDAKIHRLALSMDMPPEELTGKGDMNHWGGWLATEDGIKLHIEPLANMICDGITQKYHWPALMPLGADPEEGVPDEVRRQVIVADTSDLRQRPERSSEAMALHAELVLTDAALARETGFDKGDLLLPESPEYRRRMLQKIAGGVTTADLTAAAMKALGVEIAPVASEVVTAEQVDTAAAPQPTTGPAPVPAIEAPRNPPEPSMAASAVADALDPLTNPVRPALVLATDLLVTRAMERAKSKLFGRGRSSRIRPVTDAVKVNDALVGAWVQAPKVATTLGVDPALLTDACDRYARELLARGMEHDADLLAAVLDRGVLGG